MIDRITVRNFKSLHELEVSLGRFNLFIGDNSSGESKLLEAFQVLQGVGRGLTIREVLNGVPVDCDSLDWLGVRGGSANVCSVGNLDPSQEVTIRAQGTLEAHVSDGWDFAITFTPMNGNVVFESLRIGSQMVYSIENSAVPYIAHAVDGTNLQDMTSTHTRARKTHGDLGVTKSIIDSVPPDSRESVDPQLDDQRLYRDNSSIDVAKLVAQSLASLQHVNPLPHLLRKQGKAQQVDRMGNHCKDFMALLYTICQDEVTRDQYTSWMREFSAPYENQFAEAVESFIRRQPVSCHRRLVDEFSTLSDGTLRFAALVAAFFQIDMPEIMLIDEIETSIHAGRVRLLVELLCTQAEFRTTQVIATSHSPVLLEWLKDTSLASIFFCNRDQDTGASIIRPLLEVPRFEASLKNRHFFDVLTERWLELIS